MLEGRTARDRVASHMAKHVVREDMVSIQDGCHQGVPSDTGVEVDNKVVEEVEMAAALLFVFFPALCSHLG